MDAFTTLCAVLAALAAVPALDGFLRWRRLASPRGARATEGGRAPGRLLVLVPSRAEGARVGDLASDLKRESEKRDEERISSKVEEAGAAGGAPSAAAAPCPYVDVLVLLDGPDPDAEARLARDGVDHLSKKSPGPSKGHALAFAAKELGARLDDYAYVLVFDADMRLPEGFFRDLRIPEGTEAFQLPVRPSGVPSPGAPRVEALSLAVARLDDRARDAAGLPVRLRGKAMGFSPRAFRLGPAASTRTTAEDSEATFALLAKGVVVRALDGPFAFDEPSADAGAMGRSRARWFGGHLKLFFAAFGDLVRSFASRPVGAFVLAADLWLRPRILWLGTLAFLACASDVLMVVLSSNGAWSGGAREFGHAATVKGLAAWSGATATKPVLLLLSLLLLSLLGKSSLLFEGLSIAALRRRVGYPAAVPAVSFADLADSILMWGRAIARGVASPSRWHRARPPA